MNVTALARKLKISTKELLEILPAVGFGIGQRAIKIDDRQAQQVISQWPNLLVKYRNQIQKDQPLAEKSTEEVIQEKKVALPPFIRVKDFAAKLNLPLAKVMTELMKNGVLSAMNEQIDFETAAIVGSELGFEIVADRTKISKQETSTAKKLEQLLTSDDKSQLVNRPPVVVVMGHVDHGKTKLLDTIRQTNVIAGESGGITQHIGAYQVEKKGRLITFIDTPGHEAFTTMRSRGARVADIAILVIAADDSIQPQTKESIKIIKAADLPMIVAINKIDKAEANIERVKQDLAGLDLVPEEWGGKTICVPLSAKAGTGIDDLLEMILLVAETEKDGIVANPNRLAVGTIIESHIDRGEGPVATVLIQNGTLKKGDLVQVADIFYGKIRAMKDFKGQEVDQALPAMPVKILGLKATPSVGDILQAINLLTKRQKVKHYQLSKQALDYAKPLAKDEKAKTDIQSLNLILRADVLGSLEAIMAALSKLEHPEVDINFIIKGLGNITESDVIQAEASGAMILGFHVQATTAVTSLAKDKKVTLKIYEIIYQLLDEVKSQLEKLLKPEIVRTNLGRLKVLATFYQKDKSMVIGGLVVKGQITAQTKVEVWRQEVKLGQGQIVQVQVNRVNVNQATQGQECGLKYEGKPIIKVGDVLEVYTEETKEKKIA